jgi:hypothetical protein
MNKVLHFDGVLKNFNQHKVLSFNSKKFGTMFVTDGDSIVAIIATKLF